MAVLERTASVEVVEPERIIVSEWEIPHRYLEIRDVRNREVVTAIEVLSPWNKTSGRGGDDYQEKPEEVLSSDANLVEIDLLRQGRHTVPNVGIPLRSGEPDVVLHLQKVFNRCYDNGAYDLVIDYTEEPDLPLSEEDAAWAEALLRERGENRRS